METKEITISNSDITEDRTRKNRTDKVKTQRYIKDFPGIKEDFNSQIEIAQGQYSGRRG